jgi:hypothetical protein
MPKSRLPRIVVVTADMKLLTSRFLLSAWKAAASESRHH